MMLTTTGLRPLCRKKMASWSAGPKCGNYFHAAESGRRCDQMMLSIPDLCPCAKQSRPFGLPYGLFLTKQGPEYTTSHHIFLITLLASAHYRPDTMIELALRPGRHSDAAECARRGLATLTATVVGWCRLTLSDPS